MVRIGPSEPASATGLPDLARANHEDVVRVTAVAGGDRDGLAALYDRYAGLLLGVAVRMLGSRREAEDLVHDLFLEVWRRARDYDPARGSVRTWLLLRVRSRALDRIKSPARSRAVSLEEQPAGGALAAPAAEDDPTMGPDHQRVRRALALLPREQRAALELAYFEGLSSTEIAARLEVPVGTVKSRVAAAMAKLRAELVPASEAST